MFENPLLSTRNSSACQDICIYHSMGYQKALTKIKFDQNLFSHIEPDLGNEIQPTEIQFNKYIHVMRKWKF